MNFIPGRRQIVMLISIAYLLSACGGFLGRVNEILPSGDGVEETTTTDVSNGERIYFTAINDRGERIGYTGGPNFGGMMLGSYLTCASCHGLTAQGGVHPMHMQLMDAPDIRYSALVGEAGAHDETGQGDDHDDEHAEYDLEDFRAAVINGRHPDGDQLDRDMPRWRMSDNDLADIFEFLKTLE